ncbi:Vmc-like lipoprotein signal peptide domain-containing protein [Ureaplasma zalophigenitalium]|uniref:CARD domain-containing protein n=1 Tax=Ureaplasma zalophigenitalium TaxID=907723 RepID=A0ABT3BPI6_9BACT|nr:hypothetical protein [Ureaplasma zalophigenitalium]MCV3754108.1 hypothetical protein [Ureaplasma zalophigenitalium]
MNKKTKRILGFVLAPIALAAVITPIVTSCTKQNGKAESAITTVTNKNNELEKIRAEFLQVINRIPGDKVKKDKMINEFNTAIDKMKSKSVLTDAEEELLIKQLKDQVQTAKLLVDKYFPKK